MHASTIFFSKRKIQFCTLTQTQNRPYRSILWYAWLLIFNFKLLTNVYTFCPLWLYSIPAILFFCQSVSISSATMRVAERQNNEICFHKETQVRACVFCLGIKASLLAMRLKTCQCQVDREKRDEMR